MTVVINETDDIDFLAGMAQKSSFYHEEFSVSRQNIKEKLVQGFECVYNGEVSGCGFISKIKLPCCEIYTIDGFRDDTKCTSFRASVIAGRLIEEYARKELGIKYLFIVHRLEEPAINMLAKHMGYKNILQITINMVEYMVLACHNYYSDVYNRGS